MRAYIVTTAENPARLHTHHLFEAAGIPYRVVVNTHEQAQLAVEAGIQGPIVPDIDYTDIPRMRRLLVTRNWIMRNLVMPDEYVILANDNIKSLSMLQSVHDQQDFSRKNSREWREAYAEHLPVKDVAWQLRLIKDRMIATGAIHGGVGHPSGNYFHRPRRWSDRCYIIGDLIITKNHQIDDWAHPSLTLWDDWYRTCLSLAVSGSVACNRYIATVRHVVMTGPGSIGSYADRTPFHRQDAKILSGMFEGLVDVQDHRDDSLRLVVRSPKQLEAWRKSRGYIS